MATTTEIRNRAEAAAAEALQAYGATELFDMPIDATQFAEFFGAEVFVDDLDSEGLDGFVLIEDGKSEITINQTQPLVRRRFTCAHELGHIIDHKDALGDVGFVDNEDSVQESTTYYRDEHARDGRSRHEIFANAFAAAVLMPEKLVRLLAPSQDDRQMAKFFKVSEAAMRYRVLNLGAR